MDNHIQKKLENNIWKMYLFQILNGMFFYVPIIVLFWQENGLDLTKIMILQSFFAIVIVVFEIPTGYFADKYGRKKALLIASVSMTIAIVLYAIGHNFSAFLVAEFFFAVTASFVSGTTAALLYDTLQDLGREKEYKKIWGKTSFFYMLALGVTAIAGGLIAKNDLRYAIYASIPFFALLIPVALSFHEPIVHRSVIAKNYAKHILQILTENMVHNKELRWIVVYSGVVYAFNQASLWLYQPYFSLSGLDVVYFGFVFASFQLVAAFTSRYAYVIEAKLGKKYSLVMMIFLIAGSYFLMSNFVLLFSFSFAFLQQFVRGFRIAVVSDYINKLTTSDVRATVLSIESFIGRLLYALIIPFIGIIADAYTVIQAFFVLGVTTTISGCVMMIIFKKYRII